MRLPRAILLIAFSIKLLNMHAINLKSTYPLLNLSFIIVYLLVVFFFYPSNSHFILSHSSHISVSNPRLPFLHLLYHIFLLLSSSSSLSFLLTTLFYSLPSPLLLFVSNVRDAQQTRFDISNPCLALHFYNTHADPCTTSWSITL
jgi:hypothetical protein